MISMVQIERLTQTAPCKGFFRSSPVQSAPMLEHSLTWGTWHTRLTYQSSHSPMSNSSISRLRFSPSFFILARSSLLGNLDAHLFITACAIHSTDTPHTLA